MTDIHEAMFFHADDEVTRSSFGIWSLRWSPDGKEIIAGTGDQSLYIYDVESQRVGALQAKCHCTCIIYPLHSQHRIPNSMANAFPVHLQQQPHPAQLASHAISIAFFHLSPSKQWLKLLSFTFIWVANSLSLVFSCQPRAERPFLSQAQHTRWFQQYTLSAGVYQTLLSLKACNFVFSLWVSRTVGPVL